MDWLKWKIEGKCSGNSGIKDKETGNSWTDNKWTGISWTNRIKGLVKMGQRE